MRILGIDELMIERDLASARVCRACQREKAKEAYAADPEKFRARSRARAQRKQAG